MVHRIIIEVQVQVKECVYVFNSWPCIVAMPTHTWDFYGLLVMSHRRSIEVDRGKKMEDGRWKMERK
jgi:hypothetical protein